MPVNCYSQRILNPFRGVMNIISIGGADAVTIDGYHWTLYVHDTFDCPTDDPKEFFEIDMPDIRFGDWDKESGLKHSPLIAGYHYNEIQAIGHALLDAVIEFSEHCPFHFEDKYELWLLDERTQEPLALLNSVCNKNEICPPDTMKWESGLRCKQEFLNDFSPLDKQLASTGDLLNQLINQRAGKQPSAQWFYRNRFDYGKGLSGINLSANLANRELSARLFPKLLVQQQWRSPCDEMLFTAFIDWLSPYLLVLDFLHDEQRQLLEQSARQYALLVEKLYPLYPKIIDKKAINSARVEAVLRRSSQHKARDKEAEAIEYIETQHSLI